MTGCPAPLPWDTLVDYWAGDLPRADSDRVDDHLFGCPTCADAALRVGAMAETLRDLLPPAVSRARLNALRAAGVRLQENVFWPGERRPVVFEDDAELLIHRLAGLDLAGADHVSLRVVVESTGDCLVALDAVPFERDEGAVLIACQRHFASLPPDTRFELAVHAPSPAASQTDVAYTILHQFPPG
jgi:hypothetical protein